MEIFNEICYGYEYKYNELFTEWHRAIIKDLDRFGIILKQYNESKDKSNLISVIDYIKSNILTKPEEDDFIVLKNTPEYFLFSFYAGVVEMPTYVLLSKDYKKFLVATEEMECFDDEEFDENERYGIYNYDYFFIINKDVKHYQERKKEYTYDYTAKFYNGSFYATNSKKTDEYYKTILKIPTK